MSSSLRHQARNLIHSALLIGGMAAIAWVVLGSIMGPGMTFLVVAGSILGLVFAPALPKTLILSAYRARRLTGRDLPEAIGILSEIARRAGLERVPALYYVPSQLPNAFAIGDPRDSVICVTDGLLRLLDSRELAGVLAHEVSHVANRDLWIMGVADVMSRAVSMASWIGQMILLLNLPLLLSGTAYVPWHIPLLLVFSPTIMALLQLALSRTREFDADRAAVDLTGDPEGLASALLKLERRVGRFWEEMFLPGRRIPEPSLLRTHPPTEERVKRLRDLSARRWPPRKAEPLRVLERHQTPPPRFGPWGVYR